MNEHLVPDPSQQSSIRLAFDLAREVVRQVEEAHPGVDADRLEYAVAGAILGEVERAGLASSPHDPRWGQRSCDVGDLSPINT